MDSKEELAVVVGAGVFEFAAAADERSLDDILTKANSDSIVVR